jgi:hypothetical protein
MFEDFTPCALIGPDELAPVLGVPRADVRATLEARNDPPVATFRGTPLWLSDTAHEA